MDARAAQRAVVEAICLGSPREMGQAQGSAAKDKIHAARKALAQLEAFRIQQPWWLPYRVYRSIAERKARRFLAPTLQRDYPAIDERLSGIADAAAVNLESIHLFNALEPLLSSVAGCTACPGACSAVAIRGRRSATGEAIIARNFDYLPLVQPFYLVRESQPPGKLRSLDFTLAPLAGAVDGINEKGLCITYNYAFCTDTPAESAAPISFAICEALEQCGTVAEAAAWITTRPRWGGGLLMLCDAGGDIASLELSSTQHYLRRPAPGEDMLFHTNAFTSDHMREVQVPWEAVYTAGAPTPLRGRRLHESSEQRDRRFEQLLAQRNVLDADALAAIMGDHGDDGVPSDYSPCVHGSYWYTTACLQLNASSRKMRVAYDSACQARYREAEL
jgi:hypothetical protein